MKCESGNGQAHMCAEPHMQNREAKATYNAPVIRQCRHPTPPTPYRKQKIVLIYVPTADQIGFVK